MAISPTVRPSAVDEAARTGISAPAARETRGGTILNKITIDRATVEQALETLLDCEDQLVKPYNRKAYYAAEALHSALEQPNEFHPDWDQIKPFNDRIAELEKVAKQALEHVQEFKRRWWQVPAFGNKVNKATREAITNAHSPIFELEHALRAALAEQPAEQGKEPKNAE